MSGDVVGKCVVFKPNGNTAIVGIGILHNILLSVGADAMVDFIAEITSISEDGMTITVDKQLPSKINTKASLISVNEIIVRPVSADDTINITKLVLKYKPTFS